MNDECVRCNSATEQRQARHGKRTFLYRFCSTCNRNVGETILEVQKRERRLLMVNWCLTAICCLLLAFAGAMLYSAVKYGLGGH